MSTHTERLRSRKSSGRYGHGIRLNHVNFMSRSWSAPGDHHAPVSGVLAAHLSRRGAEVEGHELLIIVLVADLQAPRLDRHRSEAGRGVERSRALVHGCHVQPQAFEVLPRPGAGDSSGQQPATEAGAAPLRGYVHAPDVSDVVVLDGALPVATGGADQSATVEGAEDEIGVRADIAAKALGQRLDGIDLLGRPAKGLGMVAQGADPQLPESRGVVGPQ